MNEKKTEYVDGIEWERISFSFNPYLSRGLRNQSNMKVFVKRYPSNYGVRTQLQIWVGKTRYVYDVIDANMQQIDYNLSHNIKISKVSGEWRQ